MQFLEDAPFLNLRGKPVALAGHLEVTLGFALMFVMKTEHPGTGMKLTNTEFREWDKAMLSLEAGPNEQGYFEFEDSHFKILKKVVDHNARLIYDDELRRASPILEEILEKVTARIPKEMEALS